MKTFSQKKLWINSPSFALISVLALVSLAALTATAFLASARLERQATSSIGSTTRLEMALNSGKACAAQVVNDNSQADVGGNTHIVTYWRGGGNNDWTNELGYPFIGQTKTSGAGGQESAIWYYFPLFSPAGVTNFDTNVIQTAMRFTNTHQGTFFNDMQTYMTANATNGFASNPGLNNPKCVQIPLIGGRTSPPVGWVYLNQEKRNFGSNLTNTSPAVRIAWFTEDLEGLIDAERMGGLTTRASGTNSEEISLSSATGTNGALLSSVATFTNKRKAYISYGLLASTNVSGMANPTNARYFASGLRAWAPTNPASPNNGALAWIPAGIPISGSSTAPKGYTNQGYTKLNLNNLVSGTPALAVSNIVAVISNNLPSFRNRAGGMDENTYVSNIVANIRDYIDTDIDPTTNGIGSTAIRGIEPLPFVTETATSVWWYDHGTNISGISGVGDEFRVVNYVELWNPSDRPFSGNIGVFFSNAFGMGPPTAGGNINGVALNLSLQTGGAGRVVSNTITGFVPNGTNTISVNLAPNEYRVYELGTNIHRFRVGASEPILYGGSPATNGGVLQLAGPPNGVGAITNCLIQLFFNNVRYDQSLINRTSADGWQTARVYRLRPASPNPFYAASYPALRPYVKGTASPARPGDVRMSFYLNLTNSTVGYNSTTADPGSSLGYRNRSRSSLGGTVNYNTDYSAWLDRGHTNSPYNMNSVTEANPPPLGSMTGASATNDYVQKFNNTGIWSNVFELGNIFDPMAWNVATNNPEINTTTTPAIGVTNGGGTTLRVGRAEHQRFAFTNMYGNSVPPIPNMGMSAAALLDLFCLTNGTSVGGGPYSLGGGKINLNTAPAPVLRALAGGILLTNDSAQLPRNAAIPPAMAEAFAQGVMRFRSQYPFLTPSHLSFIGTDPAWPNTNSWPNNSVFGNTNSIFLQANAPGNTFSSAKINVTAWNDQAAEEWFSKIYALSSCQSHNYRIYVVAQLVATNSSGQTNAIGPLVKKYYQIFTRNGSTTAALPDTTTYPGNTIYSWKPAVGTIDIYKSEY